MRFKYFFLNVVKIFAIELYNKSYMKIYGVLTSSLLFSLKSLTISVFSFSTAR